MTRAHRPHWDLGERDYLPGVLVKKKPANHGGVQQLLKMSPMAQVLDPKALKLPAVAAPSLEGLAVRVPAPDDLTEGDLLRRLNEKARAVAKTRERAKGEKLAVGDDVQLDVLGYLDGKLMPFSARFGFWTELGPIPALPGYGEAVAEGAVGDALQVQLVLPDDYPLEAFRGKPARFMVDVRAAREVTLPDLDTPAGVAALGLGKTLDEAVDAIREELEDELAYQLTLEGQDLVLDELVKRAGVQVPATLVDEEVRRRWGDAEGRVMVQKEFDVDEQREALQLWLEDPATRGECERRLAIGLVLKAVAEKEKLALTPEKLEALLVEHGAQFGLDAAAVHAGLRESKETTTRLSELGWYLLALEAVLARAKVSFEGA
jgi:trigger factor